MKNKPLIFSEKYESYTIDDYIAEGDKGAFYQVVPKDWYEENQELLKSAMKLIEDNSEHIKNLQGTISNLKQEYKILQRTALRASSELGRLKEKLASEKLSKEEDI